MHLQLMLFRISSPHLLDGCWEWPLWRDFGPWLSPYLASKSDWQGIWCFRTPWCLYQSYHWWTLEFGYLVFVNLCAHVIYNYSVGPSGNQSDYPIGSNLTQLILNSIQPWVLQLSSWEWWYLFHSSECKDSKNPLHHARDYLYDLVIGYLSNLFGTYVIHTLSRLIDIKLFGSIMISSSSSCLVHLPS